MDKNNSKTSAVYYIFILFLLVFLGIYAVTRIDIEGVGLINDEELYAKRARKIEKEKVEETVVISEKEDASKDMFSPDNWKIYIENKEDQGLFEDKQRKLDEVGVVNEDKKITQKVIEKENRKQEIKVNEDFKPNFPKVVKKKLVDNEYTIELLGFSATKKENIQAVFNITKEIDGKIYKLSKPLKINVNKNNKELEYKKIKPLEIVAKEKIKESDKEVEILYRTNWAVVDIKKSYIVEDAIVDKVPMYYVVIKNMANNLKNNPIYVKMIPKENVDVDKVIWEK